MLSARVETKFDYRSADTISSCSDSKTIDQETQDLTIFIVILPRLSEITTVITLVCSRLMWDNTELLFLVLTYEQSRLCGSLRIVMARSLVGRPRMTSR